MDGSVPNSATAWRPGETVFAPHAPRRQNNPRACHSATRAQAATAAEAQDPVSPPVSPTFPFLSPARHRKSCGSRRQGTRPVRSAALPGSRRHRLGAAPRAAPGSARIVPPTGCHTSPAPRPAAPPRPARGAGAWTKGGVGGRRGGCATKQLFVPVAGVPRPTSGGGGEPFLSAGQPARNLTPSALCASSAPWAGRGTPVPRGWPGDPSSSPGGGACRAQPPLGWRGSSPSGSGSRGPEFSAAPAAFP